MDAKQFTLRLPMELYKLIAGRRSKGITSYIVEAVEEKLAREREEEIRRGFECLAGSVDADELDLWLSAQRKSMVRDD